MSSRDEHHHNRDDASEILPDEHQGFVRSGDVHDAGSQAAAPHGSGRPFDRSGEKHYESDLRQFERDHPDAERQPSAGRTLDDPATVRDAIGSELAHDPALRGVRVAVGNEGVVTLSGTVADAAAKQRAQEIAAAASGVDEVENHIVVRG